MKRREFIALVGGVAAWPLGAPAQQRTPVVGYLNSGSRHTRQHGVAAFRQGLGEAGYVEGQNVTIEYRWGDDRYDRLAGLADELVHKNVAVIAAMGLLRRQGESRD